MKILKFLKFSTQNFWRKILFLEVEVLKSHQPSNPLAWSVAILQEWIFQIKSQIREWSLPKKKLMLERGGNRFVKSLNFIIIYIFKYVSVWVYVNQYSLNNFYFFECIAGFGIISRHSNYPSSVEKHKLKRRGSREEQTASWWGRIRSAWIGDHWSWRKFSIQ